MKYDRIGVDYNDTRSADPYLTRILYEMLNPIPEGSYLDVGCGTGNYTISLSEKGLNMTGIDPSSRMLNTAKQKDQQISWRIGNVESLPFKDNEFDGSTATLTVHHWSDIEKGISEINRVLKENSHFVLFTSSPKQMKGYWLNHYFRKMLEDSIAQMPKLDNIKNAMKQSGFRDISLKKYFVRPDLKDHFLYCGKDRPEIYLDPNIRKGISSFADLSLQEEVSEGLSYLQKDIESGKVFDIMDDYKNEEGDYMFVVGKA